MSSENVRDLFSEFGPNQPAASDAIHCLPNTLKTKKAIATIVCVGGEDAQEKLLSAPKLLPN